MIDATFVAGFFGITDSRRRARFYRSAQEQVTAGEDPDAVWFRAMMRKEDFSVKDQALFSGTAIQSATQTFAVQERIDAPGKTPQLYTDCRVYDETDEVWYTILGVSDSAVNSMQAIYCAVLRPGLTPQLAQTGH